MTAEQSLEGWAPDLADDASERDALEKAFDYRGDVTLGLAGGEALVGYVCNRDFTAASPWIEIWVAEDDGPRRLSCADVEALSFTGRDTANGRSWEAWVAKWKAGRGEEWPPADLT